MSSEEPSDEQLRLVARHGHGTFTRALAIAQLARRNDRTEEVRERADEIIDSSGDEGGGATP